MVLYLRLVPLHPYDGCKWLQCHVETFEIFDDLFMKRRRVIQIVFTSWGIPFLLTLAFSLLSVRLNSFKHAMTIVGSLYLFSR